MALLFSAHFRQQKRHTTGNSLIMTTAIVSPALPALHVHRLPMDPVTLVVYHNQS